MKPEHINIAISRISELEYFINESFELKPEGQLNINFQVTTNIISGDNTVELQLSVQFAEKSEGIILLKIKTSNIFKVPELDEMREKDSETYDIPDNVMITFLSLSVSHTRALLAKNVQATKYAAFYIPIINPSDLFNQLFNSNKK